MTNALRETIAMDNAAAAELNHRPMPDRTLRPITRWKAAGLHLAISALIAGIVVALVVVLWYPRPYFVAMGGEVLLRLLIGVDVVLGPLITLIIFDTKKPRLKYDLATIAVLQLAALAYGSYVMFESRPVYNVFIGGYFQTVPASGIVQESLGRAASEFRPLPLNGPRVVGAKKPTDPAEAFRITMGALNGGPDMVNLPHLYVRYTEVAAEVARAAKPLVMLAQKGKEPAEKVNDFVSVDGRAGRSLGFVPVRARNEDFAAVVDRKTGEIVGFLPVNPW
jgi:hypothetical protein